MRDDDARNGPIDDEIDAAQNLRPSIPDSRAIVVARNAATPEPTGGGATGFDVSTAAVTGTTGVVAGQPSPAVGSADTRRAGPLLLLLLVGVVFGAGLAGLQLSRSASSTSGAGVSSDGGGTGLDADGGDDSLGSGTVATTAPASPSTVPTTPPTTPAAGSVGEPVECRFDLTAGSLGPEAIDCDRGSIVITGDDARWHNDVATVFVSDGAAATVLFEPRADGSFVGDGVVEIESGSTALNPDDARFGISMIVVTFTDSEQHLHLDGGGRGRYTATFGSE